MTTNDVISPLHFHALKMLFYVINKYIWKRSYNTFYVIPCPLMALACAARRTEIALRSDCKQ